MSRSRASPNATGRRRWTRCLSDRRCRQRDLGGAVAGRGEVSRARRPCCRARPDTPGRRHRAGLLRRRLRQPAAELRVVLGRRLGRRAWSRPRARSPNERKLSASARRICAPAPAGHSRRPHTRAARQPSATSSIRTRPTDQPTGSTMLNKHHDEHGEGGLTCGERDGGWCETRHQQGDRQQGPQRDADPSRAARRGQRRQRTQPRCRAGLARPWHRSSVPSYAGSTSRRAPPRSCGRHGSPRRSGPPAQARSPSGCSSAARPSRLPAGAMRSWERRSRRSGGRSGRAARAADRRANARRLRPMPRRCRRPAASCRRARGRAPTSRGCGSSASSGIRRQRRSSRCLEVLQRARQPLARRADRVPSARHDRVGAGLEHVGACLDEAG